MRTMAACAMTTGTLVHAAPGARAVELGRVRFSDGSALGVNWRNDGDKDERCGCSASPC